MSRLEQSKTEWRSLFSAIAASVGQPVPSHRPAASRTQAFSILVTTMISPRTKDEVTDAAAARLLARAATPRDLAALPAAGIAKLIYPAGFYRVKAGNLRAASAMIAREYGGVVPESMDELLTLPGVGRKIANLVLSRAFGQDAICVDTHVHRIANRAGWVDTRTPEQTERALRRLVPARYWSTINDLLVPFGKLTCTPLSPRCSGCPIASGCPRQGVGRSR
jgi:endonuclease III